MIHVGHVKAKIRNKDKTKTTHFTYLDVKTDKDGWADAKEYLPHDFDLVWAHTDRGKSYVGWYTGGGWDGKNYERVDRIVRWKRKEL